MGANVAATTHYAELKVYAMTTKGVENASCEFDVETLAPTYRVLIGIPGKSNAFAISRRLGLPGYIIQKAADRIDAENVRFEDVLSQLDVQRQAMEREKEKAAQLRREMEEARAKAEEYRARIEEERRRATEKAQAEARAIIEQARDAADQTFKELNEMRRRQEQAKDWVDDNEQRSELRRKLNEADAALGGRKEELPPPPPTRDAVAGDTVELVKMGTQFLDNALMGKLETVTIIHGKGTGALRKAVREHLKKSRYVKEYRPGVYGEGEDGVTVATLK